MIANVKRPIEDGKTVGTSVELANDERWAKLTIYLKGSNGNEIVLRGSPRELRALGRAIADGCKGLKYR